MAIVRCERGHYFDDAKYRDCPYCEKGVKPIERSGVQAAAGWMSAGTEVPALGWPGGFSPAPDGVPTLQPGSGSSFSGGSGVSDDYPGSGAQLGSGAAAVSIAQLGDNMVTVGGAQFGGDVITAAGPRAGSDAVTVNRLQPGDNAVTANRSQYGDGAVTASGSRAGNDALTEAFDGSLSEPSDDAPTVGMWSDLKGNDFVTGWLVCVSGPERGRDYRLYHGYNQIGRGYAMDVIVNDPSVSREDHCAVVYDGRGNAFSLVPEGGNPVYKNGKLETLPVRIKTGDLIGIGAGEYEFVAFCREGRTWEEE